MSCRVDSVALRKESVDRNSFGLSCFNPVSVALRKESVDRNYIIKITENHPAAVALRKESVDRNFNAMQVVIVVMRRSPQGERG